jgi:hypothetical protein
MACARADGRSPNLPLELILAIVEKLNPLEVARQCKQSGYIESVIGARVGYWKHFSPPDNTEEIAEESPSRRRFERALRRQPFEMLRALIRRNDLFAEPELQELRYLRSGRRSPPPPGVKLTKATEIIREAICELRLDRFKQSSRRQFAARDFKEVQGLAQKLAIPLHSSYYALARVNLTKEVERQYKVGGWSTGTEAVDLLDGVAKTLHVSISRSTYAHFRSSAIEGVRYLFSLGSWSRAEQGLEIIEELSEKSQMVTSREHRLLQQANLAGLISKFLDGWSRIGQGLRIAEQLARRPQAIPVEDVYSELAENIFRRADSIQQDWYTFGELSTGEQLVNRWRAISQQSARCGVAQEVLNHFKNGEWALGNEFLQTLQAFPRGWPLVNSPRRC